jgi:hypothetical protein
MPDSLSRRREYIYTRLIADDVIRTIIKMARNGDPALKPLIDALGKTELGINAGLGLGISVEKLSSASTLGKLAGVMGLASEVFALSQLVWGFLSMVSPKPEDMWIPLGNRNIYRAGGIPYMFKFPQPQPTPSVPVPSPPPWREIPFEGGDP